MVRRLASLPLAVTLAATVLPGCRRTWHPEPFEPEKLPPGLAATPGDVPATETEARPPSSPERARLLSEMQHHFEAVAGLEQAVVVGDLKAVRARAEAFAAEHVQPQPADWKSSVERMVAAARLAGDAEDLEGAAAAVATVAGTCGDCHRALDAVPALPPLPDVDQGRTLKAAMHRHRWATDRMWEGIVAPSEERWIRGTALFSFPPGCERGDEVSAESRTQRQALCRRVQSLGQRGHVAEGWPARIEIYGRLLATCATCHGAG